jgi:carbamoyl-phosphate synthase small subunit
LTKLTSLNRTIETYKYGIMTHLIDFPQKCNAILLLTNGQFFFGQGIGNEGHTIGEICFNTGITGYQETLTDPSYSGQIINFTFPHIGNIGTNSDDIECSKVWAKGLIIHNKITNPANYRSHTHFNEWLINNNITGISGIDTRQITRIIRKNSAQNVLIYYKKDEQNVDIGKLLEILKSAPNMDGLELAKDVATKEEYKWEQPLWNDQNKSPKYKIVAIDYGIKCNILRSLVSYGCEVVTLPADASFADVIKHKPDGVFLSNGPGDPAETFKYTGEMIKQVIANNIPMFCICLGHQLLALAVGGKTYKMHQGHRGANHPVKNLLTGKIEITSQNHGFAVDKDSLNDDVEITHISLFDNSIEGIRIKNKPVFSVQYHPESSPGPHDSRYLFAEFIQLMSQHKHG